MPLKPCQQDLNRLGSGSPSGQVIAEMVDYRNVIGLSERGGIRNIYLQQSR